MYYVPPRKDHTGDLQCDCNTVMYKYAVRIPGADPSLIYLRQVYTWRVLRVREQRSTREILNSHISVLGFNDFAQVASVDSGLRNCVSRAVSLSCRQRFSLLTSHDPFRFPNDIPQGTAVPHWAYFNVTVSDAFCYRATHSVLTPFAKTAVNQTYDGATMITIGRKFDLDKPLS